MLPPNETLTPLRSLPERVKQIILQEAEASPDTLQLDKLMQDVRYVKYVRVRWRIWWRIREELTLPNGSPFSLNAIGRMFGKDHATIMHGIKRYVALRDAGALPDQAGGVPGTETTVADRDRVPDEGGLVDAAA